MWSLSATILYLFAPLYLLYVQEAGGCNRRAPMQDSTIMASSNNRIVIKEENPTSSIRLKTSKGLLFNKSKKFCLLMSGIQMVQSPEGVYELYLSHDTINPSRLVAESSYFIDVLDTYMIANSQTPKRICIDVTNQLLNQNRNSNDLLDYTVTLLFRGNEKTDNTKAQKAGILTIDSLQLLQTN